MKLYCDLGRMYLMCYSSCYNMQSLSDEEWERIKERARTKLEQSGWVDDVRQQCRGERDTHRRVLVHRKFEERVNV